MLLKFLKTRARLIVSVSLSVFASLIMVYSVVNAALPTTWLRPDPIIGGLKVEGTSWLNISGNTNGLIVENGNVGIGTVSPGAKADIDMKSLTATEGLRISRDAAASHYSYLNIFNESNNTIFKVHENGNVGIGTSTPSAMLAIQGTSTNPLLNIVSSSSASALYIATNGSVGIGTSNPSAKLDIFNSNADTAVIIRTSGNEPAPYAGVYNFAGISFQNNSLSQGWTMGLDSWYKTGNFSILQAASPYARVFEITKEGNVGIGTHYPVSALDVNTSDGKYMHTMDDLYGGLLIGYLGSNIQARTTSDGNNKDLLLQQWGGNVGIGLSATAPPGPESLLSVGGKGGLISNVLGAIGAYPTIYGKATNINNNIGVYGESSANASVTWNFGVAGKGLGTFGYGVLGKGSYGGVYGSGGYYDFMAFNGIYASSQRVKYYLALQSDRNMVLYDNDGAIWWTGTTVSDLRLKKNIVPIDDALDKLLKLNGIRFNWINEEQMGSQSEIGVIAQEVEKDFPELIYNNKESDRKLVDYGKLSAVLIQALKEEHQQKEDLKNKVDGLEQRIIDLENKK